MAKADCLMKFQQDNQVLSRMRERGLHPSKLGVGIVIEICIRDFVQQDRNHPQHCVMVHKIERLSFMRYQELRMDNAMDQFMADIIRDAHVKVGDNGFFPPHDTNLRAVLYDAVGSLGFEVGPTIVECVQLLGFVFRGCVERMRASKCNKDLDLLPIAMDLEIMRYCDEPLALEKMKIQSPVPALECSVCLSMIMVGRKAARLPNCNHIFHDKCIGEWLKRQRSCPMCRTIC